MQKLIVQCLNEEKIVASLKSEKLDGGYVASDRITIMLSEENIWT
jgi:hypothetical protein